MEFPLILVPAVRDGDPEPFESLIEQIEVAEELGYDSPDTRNESGHVPA